MHTKQMDIEFPTGSPINQDSIVKQNEKLEQHLSAGNTINFMQARAMGIGFLNSRMSDLKKNDKIFFSRWVVIEGCKCKEYSFTEFKPVTE